jgi:tetratricopeptide (TPR) repeat protein
MVLASIYQHFDRYQDARDTLEKALKLATDSGIKVVQAGLLCSIGTTWRASGNYGEAMRLHGKSLAMARDTGNVRQQVVAHGEIAADYAMSGEREQAIREYAEAITLAHDGHLEDMEYIALIGQAEAYRMSNRLMEALQAYTAALEIAKRTGQLRHQQIVLSGSAAVLISMKAYPPALAILESSRELSHSTGDKNGEAIDLSNMSLIYHAQGKDREAQEKSEEAMKIADAIGNREIAQIYYRRAGDRFCSEKMWTEAATAYRKSIAIVEEIRNSIAVPDLQMSYLAEYANLYYGLTSALLVSGKNEEALQASEQIKARTLVELMRGGGVSFTKAMTAGEAPRARAETANRRSLQPAKSYRVRKRSRGHREGSARPSACRVRCFSSCCVLEPSGVGGAPRSRRARDLGRPEATGHFRACGVPGIPGILHREHRKLRLRHPQRHR